MATRLGALEGALARSDEILKRARDSGMEVSEAELRQMDGAERMVKARVAVHAFRTAAVAKPVDEGIRIAAETQRAGEAALKERDFRRLGLGLSLVTIVVTMLGLWLTIRHLESGQPKVRETVRG
jgi:hypothetical protein